MINTAILRAPGNWIIVALMLVIAMFAIHQIGEFIAAKTANENGV